MTATPAGPSALHDAMLPIEREEDLFSIFEVSFRAQARYVGLEAEKLGLFGDGRPLRYHARPGVQDLFEALVARFGWRAEGEVEGAPLALVRGNTSITLEPGSQLELSGAPFETVHEVAAEVELHRRELASIDRVGDLRWLGLGFHPYARQDDLDWVPKSRYATMRAYLPTRGGHGLDMMRRTATVQANFDFTSERDAMHKLRVALAASPLVTALFANSAVVEGRRLSIKSHRTRVWLDMDPDRSGLLPFAWSADATLGDYVRWALEVPMFIVKRGATAHPATHLTFRRFLREGLAGHRATRGDWETHLNTLFPEVRIKRTLEVRGADACPARYGAALPALWLGLLYDADALAAAEALLLPFGHDAWAAARPAIAVRGLATPLGGTTVGALARELVRVAAKALARRDRRDAAGRDERVYLAELEALAAEDRSVGDAVLGDWTPEGPGALADLLERAAY